MSSKEVYSELPVMPVAAEVNWEALEVGGLVSNPLTLSAEDLGRMSQSQTVQDFRCHDGWVAPDQKWEGVPVSTVLEKAGAAPDAGYLTFRGGEFTRSLTLEEAASPDVLLALRLNGRPVPRENGGPCRLVAESPTGHAHVKWVQRIEVTREAPSS